MILEKIEKCLCSEKVEYIRYKSNKINAVFVHRKQQAIDHRSLRRQIIGRNSIHGLKDSFKFIRRYNTVSVTNPVGYLVKLDKLIVKFYMEKESTSIAKAILKNKEQSWKAHTTQFQESVAIKLLLKTVPCSIDERVDA